MVETNMQFYVFYPLFNISKATLKQPSQYLSYAAILKWDLKALITSGISNFLGTFLARLFSLPRARLQLQLSTYFQSR